jgi:hypothetical protein
MENRSIIASMLIGGVGLAFAGDKPPTTTRLAADFPGSYAGTKISACLAALPSGGTCDARGFPGTQIIPATIVVPAKATLLLGATTYNVGGGFTPAFKVDNFSKIIGAGAGATVINLGSASTVGIVTATPASPTTSIEISNLQLSATNTNQTVISLPIVSFSTFKNLIFQDSSGTARNIGFLLDGGGACTCFNIFENNYILHMATGMKFQNSANENKIIGGENTANNISFEFVDANHNVLFAPSIEGTASGGTDIQFDSGAYGNVVYSPRMEEPASGGVTVMVTNNATRTNTVVDAYDINGYSEARHLVDSTGTLLYSSATGGASSPAKIAGILRHVPASSSEACVAGEIAADATYIYTCTTTNTWKRTSVGSAW